MFRVEFVYPVGSNFGSVYIVHTAVGGGSPFSVLRVEHGERVERRLLIPQWQGLVDLDLMASYWLDRG